MDRCEAYCGVACIDGSCPMANRDEYAERGYDLIRGCDECPFNRGCEDCCFEDNSDYCPKRDRNGGADNA